MLLVFGAINLDTVFPVLRLPQAGDTLRIQGGWTEPGGKGVNQAIAAARDGADVELAGLVGEDALAQPVLDGLHRHRIGCAHIHRHKGATGRAAIAVADDGHTMILADPGVNDHAKADLVPDRLLGPRTTLLVQMEAEPAETAALIARARALGTRIVMDFSPARLIDAAALRQLDVLIGNERELSWLAEHLGCGNSAASIHAALGPIVVGLSGVRGIEAVSPREYMRMAAFPVPMRDTTAAADAFAGVFAAALDRGATLAEAVRRATVAAALAVTQVGTGRTMPAAAAIDAGLEKAPRLVFSQAEVQD